MAAVVGGGVRQTGNGDRQWQSHVQGPRPRVTSKEAAVATVVATVVYGKPEMATGNGKADVDRAQPGGVLPTSSAPINVCHFGIFRVPLPR